MGLKPDLQNKDIEISTKGISNQNKSEKIVSWRTLTFFKNSGLMIRFELKKQILYFSFLEKTTDKLYQRFSEGFVIKFDIFALNELIYCLTLPSPQPWDTWREKQKIKYQIKIIPFNIDKMHLYSKTQIKQEFLALKLLISQGMHTIRQFILSPHEFVLIMDLLIEFRKKLIHHITSGTKPE